MLTKKQYLSLYQQSLDDPIGFWREQAKILQWQKFPEKIKDCSYSLSDFRIRWFEDGILNVSENCVDRHLETGAERPAILWQGDDPEEKKSLTFRELHEQVCRFANVLKNLGVEKGDRVTVYLPMIPEVVIALLACTRIGAIHSVVFAGFSPDALAGRIADCGSKILITSDEAVRGGKNHPLKENADKALAQSSVEAVVVVKRTGAKVPWMPGRDYDFQELMDRASTQCEPHPMRAEDPLFILYTSGSTGKPKGVLHTTGGYLVYAALTYKIVFDYQPGDIYWCTADVGWVTGHSYSVYGPLANGATIVLFEGVPNYPDYARFWQVVDDFKVSIFYTAPTAIRALMRMGEGPLKRTDRSSLRVLGTVGEPINPLAWAWYHDAVGKKRCPVVDTWWQTETGGILLTPLPGVFPAKPGSVQQPFFGVKPAILNREGVVQEGATSGSLVLCDSWPGQMRTVYGDHQRFMDTYFKDYPGYYFTGDGARRDEDGDFWITGRIDDVMNVSGHRLGTAEIESVINAHPDVVESVVVGVPHDIKGQAIYTFVTLKDGIAPSDRLRQDVIKWVRDKISPIAKPDHLQWATALPKTRSGKIMRRILRKIAAKEEASIGDTSTLADSSVIEILIRDRV